MTENLKKDFIVLNSTPFAFSVLFVKKANGDLRFYIDYRKLNINTKKDRYLLPLINKILARINKAVMFTKLDIYQAFHRIHMTEDSEKVTTFKTRYRAYIYKIPPFGLYGGPITFQRFINEILFKYLDHFCIIYMDNILIYSNSTVEHKEYINQII